MGGREQRERACWLLKADTQRRETEKRGDFEEELGQLLQWSGCSAED